MYACDHYCITDSDIPASLKDIRGMVSAIRRAAGQILTDDIHHTTNNHILKMVVPPLDQHPDYQGVQVSLHVNGHPDYGDVAIFKCPD